jgi:hypothetical protein
LADDLVEIAKAVASSDERARILIQLDQDAAQLHRAFGDDLLSLLVACDADRRREDRRRELAGLPPLRQKLKPGAPAKTRERLARWLRYRELCLTMSSTKALTLVAGEAHKQYETIAKEIPRSRRIFPAMAEREPQRYAGLVKDAEPELRKLRSRKSTSPTSPTSHT